MYNKIIDVDMFIYVYPGLLQPGGYGTLIGKTYMYYIVQM